MHIWWNSNQTYQFFAIFEGACASPNHSVAWPYGYACYIQCCMDYITGNDMDMHEHECDRMYLLFHCSWLWAWRDRSGAMPQTTPRSRGRGRSTRGAAASSGCRRAKPGDTPSSPSPATATTPPLAPPPDRPLELAPCVQLHSSSSPSISSVSNRKSSRSYSTRTWEIWGWWDRARLSKYIARILHLCDKRNYSK